jgi:chromosome segregation ATPase
MSEEFEDLRRMHSEGNASRDLLRNRIRELERELAEANKSRSQIDGLKTRIAELNAMCDAKKTELAAAHKAYTDLDRALMCELRDPCGTIWEHAKKLQDQLDEARKDTARLDKIERSIRRGNFNKETGRAELTEFSCHSVIKDGLRSTIDSMQEARK